MKRFNYTMNHKADEAYMAKMCHEGWAATSLVEGIWTFELCRPGQYTFRMCYLRGKSNAEVEKLKRSLAAKDIEFVSRYAFWAIFRSQRDFRLYTPTEELALCRVVRRLMLLGSVLSWLACFALLGLAARAGVWTWIPAVIFAVYGGMCTCLGVSYTGLIREMEREHRELP